MITIAALFIASILVGIFLGPIVDRFISWYTGKPIPDEETPIEMMIRRLKERRNK